MKLKLKRSLGGTVPKSNRKP